MIDPISGTIKLSAVSIPVGPSLTRSEFLCYSIGHSVLVKNEPWCSFTLRQQQLESEFFEISLYFNGDSIESVRLCHCSSEYPTAWSDWSKEKELERMEFHHAWLRGVGFDRGSYDWGTLYSDFDSKSAMSAIILRYR